MNIVSGVSVADLESKVTWELVRVLDTVFRIILAAGLSLETTGRRNALMARMQIQSGPSETATKLARLLVEQNGDHFTVRYDDSLGDALNFAEHATINDINTVYRPAIGFIAHLNNLQAANFDAMNNALEFAGNYTQASETACASAAIREEFIAAYRAVFGRAPNGLAPAVPALYVVTATDSIKRETYIGVGLTSAQAINSLVRNINDHCDYLTGEIDETMLERFAEDSLLYVRHHSAIPLSSIN